MSQVYLGQITLMAISYAPRGWHACDGAMLSISSNTALFSLLGTTYGGNGTQTFALPDLRSRVPVCAGAGPGLSAYILGQNGGQETMSLNAQNMAAHTHPGTLGVVNTGGRVTPVAPAQGNYLVTGTTVPSSGSPTVVQLGGVSVQPNNGSSAPFSVLQPYLALNFYIALQGIYPSRN